ncbi:stalk domain-containing protein [Natranaerobius thermophilus]|uniref:Copper amine oxidase domain protein n=1 Tax=Natranaerobius thermophilus (strain ATCC BAA-1301 / DSM 18059 / JW/NM-WN-LF) TaxID=457570 RepID=B2A7H8_NATTJ|nr:stalk domain-containing protein [Natranaerobius thermophilus]ACB85687.1 copper amine oxidase domain protein [Natranaerobius thermophilus JW/NM-WN-LF]
MKKIICFGLCMVLVFSLNSLCFAEETKVIVDGEEIDLQDPVRIIEGRTLLPARPLFESLDAEMNWNPKTETAIGKMNGHQVEIPLNEEQAKINDEPRNLEVQAETYEGRTYIPLRFAGEALGGTVEWDSKKNAAIITTDAVEPDPAKKETSPEKTEPGQLTAHFIDVGQGDAIFLEAPCDSHILVDGGLELESQPVVNYLEELGINKIEKVVATHPHQDHIGGLIDVYQNFDVKTTYDSGYEHDTLTYEKYYEIANDVSNFKTARQGDKLEIDSLGAEFIHPPQGHTGEVHDLNLVLEVEFKNQSLLLTGDAEKDTEQMIIERASDISSEILKIGHHGSYTSSSEEFLEAVDPEAAVIQVGEDNQYGHPHDQVLERLAEQNIEIYRTDYHDDIVMELDENTWQAEVEPWKKEDGELPTDQDADDKDTVTEEKDDQDQELININQAEKEELTQIINIDVDRAEQIVELRKERPFTSLDDLERVKGLAEVTIGEIKDEGIAYVD